MQPAWVEVDLEAIRHNVRAVRGVLRRGTQLMVVVKADGYGHGAVPVARAAVQAGAGWLGVARFEEAMALRRGGLDVPILVLGYASPEVVAQGALQRVSFSVFSGLSLQAMERGAAQAPVGVAVHLKIDTGMTRTGFGPEECLEVADRLAAIPGLHLEGVYTHFATADTDLVFAQTQLRTFLEVVERLRVRGHHPPFVHAANSAATFAMPESHLDLVRVGIAAYGLSPGVKTPPLRPALRLVARAVRVRRVPAGTPVSYGARYRTTTASTILTVPVGYGDGLPRAVWEDGSAWVRGFRVRYAGVVCMDFAMLDAGDLQVEEGEEVELIGPRVPAEEVARCCGTIPYEVVTRLSARLPRVYLGGEAE